MPKFLEVTNTEAARSALGVIAADNVASVKEYGAKGDGRQIVDAGSITSGSKTLTVTGADFTSSDVGKTIVVYGAGANGVPLTTTIEARVSATQVTLTAAASTTASSKEVVWGTNDTQAIQNALASGKEVIFPPGFFVLVYGTVAANNTALGPEDGGTYLYCQGHQSKVIRGAGRSKTTLYLAPTTTITAGLVLNVGSISDLKIDAGFVPVATHWMPNPSSNTMYLSFGVARDLEITRSRSSCIIPTRATIENCLLNKFGDHAIYAAGNAVPGNSPSVDIRIVGNNIVEDASYFIAPTMGPDRGSIKFRENVQRCIISDNYIQGDMGVYLSASDEVTEGIPKWITVTGNIFNCRYAGVMAHTAATGSSTALTSPATPHRIEHLVVSGNTFQKSGANGYGIILQNSSATVVGNYFNGVLSGVNSFEGYSAPAWTITGNTFVGCGSAIYGAPIKSFVVGNTVRDCATGVWMNRHATVSNNLFTGCTTMALGMSHGSSATEMAVVRGNSFTGNVLALFVNQFSSGYHLADNAFSNNTTLANIENAATFNASVGLGNRVISGTGWPAVGSIDAVSVTPNALSGNTIPLASNTLSGTLAQFNTALSDANFATLAGAETLTSKTIALGSNTVSGTLAEFNAAVSDADLATLAGVETLSGKTINAPDNGYFLRSTGGFNVLAMNNNGASSNANISHFRMTCRAGDGSTPVLEVLSTASNCGMALLPKGNGTVRIAVGASQTATLEANGGTNNLNLLATNSVLANGVPVATRLTGTAALDFGVVTANSHADLTMTVTGAAVGDAVALGVPHDAVKNGLSYFAWVSATDTVTVRASNCAAPNSNPTNDVDPGSGTFRATVIR